MSFCVWQGSHPQTSCSRSDETTWKHEGEWKSWLSNKITYRYIPHIPSNSSALSLSNTWNCDIMMGSIYKLKIIIREQNNSIYKVIITTVHYRYMYMHFWYKNHQKIINFTHFVCHELEDGGKEFLLGHELLFELIQYTQFQLVSRWHFLAAAVAAVCVFQSTRSTLPKRLLSV